MAQSRTESIGGNTAQAALTSKQGSATSRPTFQSRPLNRYKMAGENLERTQYTVEEAAQQEGNKLLYDALKHLTSLNTGSIVILATFLEKLFRNAHWKPLVVVAFVSFILSIISAFISMGATANRVYYHGKLDEGPERFHMWTAMFSLGLFLIGVITFSVFSVRNFID